MANSGDAIDTPWGDCRAGLAQEIEKVGLKHALDTTDLLTLQSSIDSLCATYERKNVTKLVREKLSPHFEHMKSFERAVSLSAQVHQSTIIIWAGLQAVIECACRFCEHVEDTLEQFADFCKTLPQFEEYMNLFPNNIRLKFALSDLYKDYGKFCVLTIRYMKNPPLTNIAKAILSSKARLELKSLKRSALGHKADFEKATEFAFRHHTMTTLQKKTAEVQKTPTSSTSRNGSAGHRSRGRSPGSPSSISWQTEHILSLGKNPMFLGRDNVLDKLHNRLRIADFPTFVGPRSCLVHGLAGIGKTQMVLEYTYRFRGHYDHIIWLPAKTPSELKREYMSIATKIGGRDVLPPSDLAVASRMWLEQTDEQWLIVFDEVENWHDIEPFWPGIAKSQSAIIVTSQMPGLRVWMTSDIALQSLRLPAGSRLLTQTLNLARSTSDDLGCLDSDNLSPSARVDLDRPADIDDEENIAKEIVGMFGGLPLVIAHIAGYISESMCTLAEFKDMVARRHSDFWHCEKPTTLYQYDKRLDAVWDDALSELHLDAKTLIYAMAFLNPDFIPEEMLLSHFRLDLHGAAKKARFMDMTRQLGKRHLVYRNAETETPFFTIHRTLQRAILYKLDKDVTLRNQAFTQSLERVRLLTPHASAIQVPDLTRWPKFETALPQVFSLREAFLQSVPPIVGTEEFAKLLYDAGFNTWEREMSHQGLELLGTAEDILNDRDVDADSKLRADIHAIAGAICDNVGETMKTQGLQHRKKALEIRKLIESQCKSELDRNDEILLYNAQNDMAEAHLQNYQYREAQSLTDICRKKYEEWGTEARYPFEYGKYWRNTGACMALQGRFKEAIESGSRAVELAEGVLTNAQPVSPRYLFYAYDVACYIFQDGAMEDALDMHKFILDSRKSVCGDLHDVTLQSYYTVGAIYAELGKLEEAEKWIRAALERAKEARWPEEARSRAQFHLAQVLRARKSDLIEVAELEKQALQVLDKHRAEVPFFLRGVEDHMILFDHLQPLFRGRFTGKKLLNTVATSQ